VVVQNERGGPLAVQCTRDWRNGELVVQELEG